MGSPRPGTSPRGPAAAALALLLLGAFARAEGEDRHVLTRPPALQESLDLGLPGAALSSFRALPPAARGRSPVLPALLEALAWSGREAAALALFEETRPHLAEPVRSRAYLALGRILWAGKKYDRAVKAFGETAAGSPAAREASLYIARFLASGGNTGAALRTLATAPPGRPSTRIMAAIDRSSRRSPASSIRPGADNGTPSPPEVVSASLSRAATLVFAGNAREALLEAREGLAAAHAWKEGAAGLAPWDGTRAGAEELWAAMLAAFPPGEDASDFFGAGGAFLASARLKDAAQAAANGLRETARRTRGAKAGLLPERKDLDARIARVGEIRAALATREKGADRIAARMPRAADAVPLAAWAKREDPGTAALLGEMDRRLGDLSDRMRRVREETDRAAERRASRALGPEDRKMIQYARDKAVRLGDDLAVLEGKAAVLGWKTRNRWKSIYLARTEKVRESGVGALREVREDEALAEAVRQRLLAARQTAAGWVDALEAADRRQAARGALLAARIRAAREAAERDAGNARRELIRAVERRERELRYLAARAATGMIAAGEADNAALPMRTRRDLLEEARIHWEGALPPRGETSPVADEVLYALAGIGYEQARAASRPGAEAVDLSVPVRLYRRVVDEHPGSPYAESARYGLALCLAESGDGDGAAAALSELIARNPRSEAADDARLFLGERLFARYEFEEAEAQFRQIRPAAPPSIRAAASYKLGWALTLAGRPREAVDPFVTALLAAPGEAAWDEIRKDSVRMAARSLIEANMEKTAADLMARRGAERHGPDLLIGIQEELGLLNRPDDAVAAADRLGAAYPLSALRVDAEIAAAQILGKAGRPEERRARRARFHTLFGPGTAWSRAPGRTAAEEARAAKIAEEGLRESAFELHALLREEGDSGSPPKPGKPARGDVLRLYDAHRALFRASPLSGEVAYQRAWLLFEDGRKREARDAFEEAARGLGGSRGEASWYMAVQSAKDILPGAAPADAEGASRLEEVIRLSGEYERAYPAGGRLGPVLMDRARARYSLGRFPEAASDADRATRLSEAPAARRQALRLSGDAKFESRDFAGAEEAFRAAAALGPDPKERGELDRWTAFSMFRRAEGMSREEAAAASALFGRIAREFPSLDISPTAMFRSGTAAADAGRDGAAVEAFLAVEAIRPEADLSRDATRWLAVLYDRKGEALQAAPRYERLGALETDLAGKSKMLLRAAALYGGRDEGRARAALLAVAKIPGIDPSLRIDCLFRAGESAAAEGKPEEADRLYGDAASAHGASPGAAPATAGKALLRRAEYRLPRYKSMAIVPPLEKTYAAKEAALEECQTLYGEAVRLGDADTVTTSLHRIGEGLENFRDAVLSSPPPKGLSGPEREEYVFLLEEKAAPIEEKAVEAYRKNLRQAVAAGHSSPWAMASLARLKALRPGSFKARWEYAFPVVAIPDFVGILERAGP